jgi:hypothetical protein
MLRLRTAALLLGVTLLAGCEKGGPQDILATVPGSRVKFFNFGVNAPNVNFYANNTKLTAISSATGAESAIGTAYGAAGSSGLYSAVDPGQYTLSGRISAATDKDLAVATVNQQLESGKYYSFFMSGIYDATAKKVDSFVIEDAFPAEPDYTMLTIRFVNAISNSQPLQLSIRNPATNVEAAVGTPVAYKAGTAFVTLPATAAVFTGTNGVVDLVVRTAGSTTPLIIRTATGFGTGRAYSVAARGDATVTSATAATRPLLDVTVHR